MRPACLFFALLVLPGIGLMAQQAGAVNYALGSSSVMWAPGPASLFLNPAELARARQSDFGFNSAKITGLSSFAGSAFLRAVGTFGAGVSVRDTSSRYSFGYALPIGRFHSIGLGLTGFRKTEESIGFSFGTSLHFPDDIENSGIHFGASIIDLSENTSSTFFNVNIGAAYWIINDEIRLQAAYRHDAVKNHALVGIEALALPGLSLQLGTRSFEEISGGVSFRFSYGSVDIAAGKAGLTLSVRAALSDLAVEQHNMNLELAHDAAREERYADALTYYNNALDYDPYSFEAQAATDAVDSLLKLRTNKALVEAADLMAKKDFVEASKAYLRVLRMDPENEEAKENLDNVQPTMRGYISRLITVGDSLRDQKEMDRARQNYEQAQELDPKNDSLPTRIASLEVMARVGIRTQLSRAKTLLDRNQLDQAEREYERVRNAEPRNSQALQGLATIRTKRRDLVFQKGKELFGLEKYMEALTVFLDVLKQDERHSEAKSYVDRTRQILQPMLDNYFRSGLQYYTKENYKAALDEWEKGLLIDPNHQGTLEYKTRAEEKLKALERLK